MFLPPISGNTSTIPPSRRISKNQDSHIQAAVDNLVNRASADKFQLNVYYYTLYSLSVFSLSKSLHLILEISANYRLVSYLLADNYLICRLYAQCMISNNNNQFRFLPCVFVVIFFKTVYNKTIIIFGFVIS